MIIKIIGLGPVGYVTNKLNCFDASICLLSIVELGNLIKKSHLEWITIESFSSIENIQIFESS